MRLCSLISATAFAFLLCSLSAYACSCSSGAALCDVAYRQAAVFVGTVTEMLPQGTSELPGRKKFVTGWNVRLSIQEGFWGTSGTEAVVHTGSGMGDCGFPFEKGKQYLLFAYKGEQDSLEVGICGYSSELKDAQQYLPELRRLASSSDGGKIFGRVAKFQKNLTSRDLEPKGALAGVKISARSQGDSRSTLSRSDGSYEFLQLPPGTYKVTAELPESLTVEEEYSRYQNNEIKLENASCANLDFRVRVNGRISGRVVDGTSAAIPNAKVVVLAESNVEKLEPWQ